MSDTIDRTAVQKVVFDSLEGFGVEAEELSLDATLEDLHVTSLDMVELSQIVQEEFGVQMHPEDAKDVRTVADVVDLIASRPVGATPASS